jgi:HD superfamily phosphohydrolase
MGLSYLVYPGAHHTRFHHALGSLHLMGLAIQSLRLKKIPITAKEEEGLLVAILLHDIGHGPFSHAMEYSLVQGIVHETISTFFMEALNEKFEGRLSTGIAIFKGTYHKKFLNQLVASQLDIDRLDYLKRDSFYTGVAEGNINAERLITMFNVHKGELVIEEKGIYSVEKFLMARRFMYWQVYLHKTSLVAEQLLINVLKRARALHRIDINLQCSPALKYFLGNSIRTEDFGEEVLQTFAQLDDVDVLAALKSWQDHDDFVLSNVCSMLINRRLLHIKLKNKPFNPQKLKTYFDSLKEQYGLSDGETAYFVFQGTIENKAYDNEQQNINILLENGKIKDVAEASDHFNLQALSTTVTKYYRCYPKKFLLPKAS